MFIDILLDTAIDTIKTIPFLYLTYLLMEYIEDRTQNGSILLLKKHPSLGPVVGSAAGVIPQCGFSAAAASLYAGGIISAGSLIAIFLSTSDEMLPILLSEKVAAITIFKILGSKFLIGLITGLIIDMMIRIFRSHVKPEERHIHDLCDEEHCGCEGEGGNIFKSALVHTLKIAVFIFLIALLSAFLIEGIGEKNLSTFLQDKSVIGVFLSALIGLIPNCGASVAITTLYLKGLIDAGQMMAGLLVSAGVGLLVLFRSDRTHLKDDLIILLVLYVSRSIWGLIIQGLGIVL